jgi:hypothetical protein
VATNHTSDVDLFAYVLAQAAMSQQVGASTEVTEFFLYTDFHDSRSQVIYLASELGGAGSITNISFYLMGLPSVLPLQSYTVRLKHTNLSAYSTPEFEPTGWHTGFSADLDLGENDLYAWFNLPIDPPFAYNGLQNLMIDFSFNNDYWDFPSGYVRKTDTGNEVLHYQGFSDSNDGDPLLWSGTSGGPLRYSQYFRPNLLFQFVRDTDVEVPVAVTPAVMAGAQFTNGTWSGPVAVHEVRTNVALRAAYGAITADSSFFDVWAELPAGPIPLDWLARYGLPPDADPDGNPDNDPFTTIEEYVADTDPTNGVSYLRVTGVQPGPPLEVAFAPSSTGRLYTLRYAASLTGGVWTNLPGQGPQPGTGGAGVLTDTNAVPARFYRVGVSLP